MDLSRIPIQIHERRQDMEQELDRSVDHDTQELDHRPALGLVRPFAMTEVEVRTIAPIRAVHEPS